MYFHYNFVQSAPNDMTDITNDVTRHLPGHIERAGRGEHLSGRKVSKTTTVIYGFFLFKKNAKKLKKAVFSKNSYPKTNTSWLAPLIDCVEFFSTLTGALSLAQAKITRNIFILCRERDFSLVAVARQTPTVEVFLSFLAAFSSPWAARSIWPGKWRRTMYRTGRVFWKCRHKKILFLAFRVSKKLKKYIPANWRHFFTVRTTGGGKHSKLTGAFRKNQENVWWVWDVFYWKKT